MEALPRIRSDSCRAFVVCTPGGDFEVVVGMGEADSTVTDPKVVDSCATAKRDTCLQVNSLALLCMCVRGAYLENCRWI